MQFPSSLNAVTIMNSLVADVGRWAMFSSTWFDQLQVEKILIIEHFRVNINLTFLVLALRQSNEEYLKKKDLYRVLSVYK